MAFHVDVVDHLSANSHLEYHALQQASHAALKRALFLSHFGGYCAHPTTPIRTKFFLSQ